MGSRSTSRSSATSGAAVSSSTTSRSRKRLLPAAYLPIQITRTPSSVLHADTIESGMTPGGASRRTSSTAVPS
jgi:hypothetical protein